MFCSLLHWLSVNGRRIIWSSMRILTPPLFSFEGQYNLNMMFFPKIRGRLLLLNSRLPDPESLPNYEAGKTSAGRLGALGSHPYIIKSTLATPHFSLRLSPHCYPPPPPPSPSLPPTLSSSSPFSPFCCSGTIWFHHMLLGHPPPSGSDVLMIHTP